jgi:hypothetical protein
MRAPFVITLTGWFLLGLPSPAQTAAPNAVGPCVDVQVGGERVADIDCINRQLRLSVEQAQAKPALAAPIDASSPSTEVGTANQAAAEQKMGGALGKSAQPQRPRPPSFVVPLAVPPSAH